MGWRYRIVPEHRLVHSVAIGVVRLEEIERHALRLRGDQVFRPDFSQFVDYRLFHQLQLRPEHMPLLARLNPFGTGARRAIVVGSDETEALAHAYARLAEGAGNVMLVTRDEPAAWRWLGVEPAVADGLRRAMTSGIGVE